jgi:hypothetical protein
MRGSIELSCPAAQQEYYLYYPTYCFHLRAKVLQFFEIRKFIRYFVRFPRENQ